MLPLTQPTAEFSVSQTWHWLASSLPGSLLFTPAPPHPRFSPSTAASQPLRGSRCFQACLKLSSRHGEGHRWVWGSRLGTWLPWAEPLHPYCVFTAATKSIRVILPLVSLGSLPVHPLEWRPGDRERSGKPTSHMWGGWGYFIYRQETRALVYRKPRAKLLQFLRFPVGKMRH